MTGYTPRALIRAQFWLSFFLSSIYQFFNFSFDNFVKTLVKLDHVFQNAVFGDQTQLFLGLRGVYEGSLIWQVVGFQDYNGLWSGLSPDGF